MSGPDRSLREMRRHARGQSDERFRCTAMLSCLSANHADALRMIRVRSVEKRARSHRGATFRRACRRPGIRASRTPLARCCAIPGAQNGCGKLWSWRRANRLIDRAARLRNANDVVLISALESTRSDVSKVLNITYISLHANEASQLDQVLLVC